MKQYKNLIGAEIRKRRNALGWSQSQFAIKLQLAGLDYDRSQVSKIECRLVHISDYELMYLARVLRTSIGDLFVQQPACESLYSYMQKAMERKRRACPSMLKEG